MPIYVYAEERNDAKFIEILDAQLPDSVSSVDVAELNLVSIDVAATSKDVLDEYMGLEGFTYLHTATNVISGNQHWGSFTTANEPVTNVATGDTGYDTTKNQPVYYDGAAWVDYNIFYPTVADESTTQTLPDSTDYVRIDASAGTPTFTLPTAANLPQGKDLEFKLVNVSGANYGELVLAGGDSIDGVVPNRRIGGLNDVFSIRRVSGTEFDIINDTRNISGAISHTGGVIAQAGIGTTPVIITAFNNNVGSYNGLLTADQANNFVTVDHVEDTVNGDQYVIIFNVTYEFASSNILTLEVYYNGVATGIISIGKGLGTSSDELAMGTYGTFNVTTAANFEIRANNSTGTDTANWYAGSFVVKRAR